MARKGSSRRRELAHRPSTTSAAALNEPSTVFMLIELSLLAGELSLKVRDGRRMIGTFLFSTTGLRFARANQKRKPDRELTYAVLSRLMEVGL